MAIVVYNAPTQQDPGQFFIGLPEAVKADQSISAITVTQTEILPPPSSSADLIQSPESSEVGMVEGTANLVSLSRDMGSTLNFTTNGSSGAPSPPLEFEEISFPPGFIHLSDVPSWVIYNYNEGWNQSDSDYTVLPGNNNIPYSLNYDIVQKQHRIYCSFESPIETVCVYYRRTYQDPTKTEPSYNEDHDWVLLEVVEASGLHVDLPAPGRYIIRAIPHISGYPLHSYQELSAVMKESFSITYSYIQRALGSFLFKFRGIPSARINKIEIWENKTGPISVINLAPDTNGRIDVAQQVVVNSTSSSNIEIRYKHNRSIHHSEFFKLRRFIGNTGLTFSTEKVNLSDYGESEAPNTWEGQKFKITVSDPTNLLYSPASAAAAFETDPHFNLSVKAQQKIARIKIIRHQNDIATDYGSYCINIDTQSVPEFLESPPFLSLIHI